jgi:hypothetical protein
MIADSRDHSSPENGLLGVSLLWRGQRKVSNALQLTRPCRCLLKFSARLRVLWYRTQDVAACTRVMTKGEVLRYATLRRSRKIIRGLKEGLTEEERYAVADHIVAQLKERGDPWRLNEEAPTAGPPCDGGRGAARRT